MNPLHTIHVLYRHYRRRHHVWLVAKLWERSERRAKRRHARWLRSMRKQVLPAPAGANPHWACGGTDEVRQMQRLRTR